MTNEYHLGDLSPCEVELLQHETEFSLPYHSETTSWHNQDTSRCDHSDHIIKPSKLVIFIQMPKIDWNGNIRN